MRKLYGMHERIAEPAMGKPLGPRQFWAVAGCMPVAVVGLIWLAFAVTP